MPSLSETVRQMDSLEEDARRVMADRTMTPMERRLAFERLLRRYQVLDDYRAALSTFIRRMRQRQVGQTPTPEKVMRDILAAPEFALLRLVVMALFVAAVYGEGPRSEWVPMTLLLAPSLASSDLRL